MDFDAVLLLSFGGPEGPEQVRPFLENVTRGRNIPPERLDDVAQHYLHFGGISPINRINRDLIAQLQAELDIPVYFGNRNWEPYVEDAVSTMRDNGIRRAAVFTTSAWSGYSGCTQYSEDLDRPGRRPVRMRPNWSNCDTISTTRCSSRCSPTTLPPRRRPRARGRAAGFHRALGPVAADDRLRPQAVQPPSALRRRACRGGRRIQRLRRGLAVTIRPPQVPWLEPDVADHVAALAGAGTKAVIVCPIGFVADHIEVVWDLDTELRAQTDAARYRVARATHTQCRPAIRPACAWT